MKKFYSFKYWGSKTTTTGFPNRLGRCSIAGDVYSFSKKSDRDAFGYAVTLKELQRLCAGMSRKELSEYVEFNLDNSL